MSDKCIFDCAKGDAEPMIDVEMNVAKDGTLLASSNDPTHAERRPGKAHQSCYKEWYEYTYKVPFG